MSNRLSSSSKNDSGEEEALQGIQRTLCCTLHFSLYDLEMNQKGRLSNQQRNKLLRWAIVGLIPTSAFFSLLSWFLFTNITAFVDGIEISSDRSGYLCLLFLVIFFLSFFFIVGSKMLLRIFLALYGKAHFIEGLIKMRTTHDNESGTHFYYSVGGLELHGVNARAFETVDRSVQYRLYYVPIIIHVLSIKPLELPIHSMHIRSSI